MILGTSSSLRGAPETVELATPYVLKESSGLSITPAIDIDPTPVFAHTSKEA